MGPSLDTVAEGAHRRFVSHCEHCPICLAAHGEWAEPSKLCPTGRALSEVWAKAEHTAAANRTSHHGEQRGDEDSPPVFDGDDRYPEMGTGDGRSPEGGEPPADPGEQQAFFPDEATIREQFSKDRRSGYVGSYNAWRAERGYPAVAPNRESA